MQDFLFNYVMNVFDEAGIGDLSLEKKKIFGSEFALQLEREIGNTLVPQLSGEGMAHFVELLDSPNTSVDEWRLFWQTSIPSFESQIKTILESFKHEITEMVLA